MRIKFESIKRAGTAAIHNGDHPTRVPNFYSKENGIEANTSIYPSDKRVFLLRKKMEKKINEDINKIQDSQDNFSFTDFEDKYLNVYRITDNRDCFYRYCLDHIDFKNYPEDKIYMEKELKHENYNKFKSLKNTNETMYIIFNDFLDTNIFLKIDENIIGDLLNIEKNEKTFNFEKISSELKNITSKFDQEIKTYNRSAQELIRMTSHIKRKKRSLLNKLFS